METTRGPLGTSRFLVNFKGRRPNLLPDTRVFGLKSHRWTEAWRAEEDFILPGQPECPRFVYAWQVGDRGLLFDLITKMFREVEVARIIDVRFIFFKDEYNLQYVFEAHNVQVTPIPWTHKELWASEF